MKASMAPSARPSGRFSAVLAEIEIALESEMAEAAAAEATERVARFAEELNQAARRLRQAEKFTDLAGVLADCAASFCDRCAVFEIAGETATVRAGRGIQGGAVALLETAGALRAAMESGDPVSALATPGEVSQAVVNLFKHSNGERVSLFPIDQSGFLYACGNLRHAPLELLATIAGTAYKTTRKSAPPELVSITSAAPAGDSEPQPAAGPAARNWSELDPKEQRLHLRAQQFARTEVAQLRLHRSQAVVRGRADANLYAALRVEMDALRETFQAKFLSPSPSMVDYVHLELLRTLANDDAALLGPDYPGPLV
jgi:hypothetical protein